MVGQSSIMHALDPLGLRVLGSDHLYCCRTGTYSTRPSTFLGLNQGGTNARECSCHSLQSLLILPPAPVFDYHHRRQKPPSVFPSSLHLLSRTNNHSHLYHLSSLCILLFRPNLPSIHCLLLVFFFLFFCST